MAEKNKVTPKENRARSRFSVPFDVSKLVSAAAKLMGFPFTSLDDLSTEQKEAII